MKTCGFTIVRNAIKYGYPVVESIQSILPLCDKVIVAVGKSDDDTLALIKSIDPQKIEIVETVWDDSLRKGGKVLAVETNKAFDAIPIEYDWCIYIQADEVLHEQDYPTIKEAMLQYKDASEVEGLLFKYLHFWGTFDYIGVNRQWYRQEIRIVKNDKFIRSYRDAQGFRKNDEKLKVKQIEASVYHYGWVRPPAVMLAKQRNFTSLYLNEEQLQNEEANLAKFSYNEVDAVKKFTGSHPKYIQNLINRVSWEVNIDETKINMNFKDRVLYTFEKIFKYRLFEYKNFIKI